ncbi:zinc ABC transporter permease [Cutibacterium sp. WCA-380-WT-3A]|uniref:Zinc ABC transporter permease n=1 Tax=Cutibacterium porci TaxID=2605781 RepID=A0A7K0J4J1_9ACTN|nr:zinc ABC transporter permease [Cutibacterium porci]MSS44849.1 zinc ABC transporter permease [Cutibacterium porci]
MNNASTVGSKIRDIAGRIGGIRVPDFLFGMIFILGRYDLGLPLPIDVVLMALAITVSTFVRPTIKVWGLGYYALLWLGMLSWVISVSIYLNQPWEQRSLRWFLLVLFSMCIAQGRILWPSFIAGYAFGLLAINIPVNSTSLRSPGYQGYLVGFLGDKNVAGLVYAVVGILALAVLRSTRTKMIVVLAFAVALFFTGSRTSMMAFAAGCVWIFVRNRLALFLRLFIALMGWMGIRWVEENLARVGVFSDRMGTDWFRGIIEVATAAKVNASPWYGNGLGTAWVMISENRRMWFHDSYAALRIEGGIPLFLAVVGLFVFVVWGLTDQRTETSDNQAIVEGAAVTVLVCAWKLGEVFFTVPAFVVIGISLCVRYGSPVTVESETSRHNAVAGPVLSQSRGRSIYGVLG